MARCAVNCTTACPRTFQQYIPFAACSETTMLAQRGCRVTTKKQKNRSWLNICCNSLWQHKLLTSQQQFKASMMQRVMQSCCEVLVTCIILPYCITLVQCFTVCLLLKLDFLDYIESFYLKQQVHANTVVSVCYFHPSRRTCKRCTIRERRSHILLSQVCTVFCVYM